MAFQFLLRSWLEGMVRQKVQETVIQAAQDHVQGAAKQAADAAAAPCHAGAVFALGIESGGFEDLLGGAVTTQGDGFSLRQGTLGGRRMAVVLAGAGRTKAARATEALIAGHHPQWILSAGFAGGLDARLGRHNVLLADHVADMAGNQLTIDVKVDPAALDAAPDVHVGRLLTADHIIRTPAEKQALGRQYHALAVDMETFAVAEVCRQHQVRFLAVRVINDPADEELPHDVEHLLAQQSGAARLGAALGAIWRRPASFKDMMKLKERALIASDRLAKFLAGMIEQLAPRE
jgi:adenosylhomocysteine nucleosidase